MPHDFKDDLESLIYVLLWMTLMYLDCSDPKHVPSFLEGVLDPQPHHNVGGFSKANFLIERTFLTQVYFPGQSALHKLIYDLAWLFAGCYEEAPDTNA